MVELRVAQLSDYAAISKLHAESWRQNYRGICSDKFLDNEVEQDRLNVWYERLRVSAPNQQVTIAAIDKTIVGFSCLYINDDPVFGSLLDNLHVAVNQQKSGIGTLLLKQCAKQICDECDSNNMYLWVFEINRKARNFYERLGGTNFEILEKQFHGSGVPTCRYIWNDVSLIL